MKKSVTLLFILFSFCISFAQPDLQIINLNLKSASSLQTADYIEVSAQVKNSGNAQSNNSRIGFLLSTPANTTDFLLGASNVEVLQAGATSASINFILPVSSKLISGNYTLIAVADFYAEVNESNENNNTAFTSPITIISSAAVNQHLPYPILFIHGVNSDNLKWDSLISNMQSFYGFSFGGNFDFCLNADENNTTALFANDYIDFTAQNGLTNFKSADMYTVNFNVTKTGVFGADFLSDQSALYKGGFAVRDAIKYIMDLTGKDKVIIIAHSQGGLQARDYLQNNFKWQSDGKHHVAKLATIATPHGGTNISSFGAAAIFTGLDESSESARDLRYSYNNGSNGRFLFGGVENSGDMKWGFFQSFKNVDINCNGVVGDVIVGLNNMSIPADVDYACIIGTGYFNGGDGIVTEEDRANINSYPANANLQADTFMIKSAINNLILHNDLPSNFPRQAIQNIDETHKFSHALELKENSWNFGHITTQSPVNINYPNDVDVFSFTAPVTGSYKMELNNIVSNSVTIKIFSEANTNTNAEIYTYTTNGVANISETLNLFGTGKFYLQITATPLFQSWETAYALKVTNQQPSSIADDFVEDNYIVFPNPANNSVSISNKNGVSDNATVSVYSSFGQLVHQQALGNADNVTINLSSFASGLYTMQINTNQKISTRKLVVSH